MRVLVVEDSAPVRSRIVGMLRDAGLDVVGEASSARAALTLTSSLCPDAVILDLQLPDGNGMDILPALKATTPLPIIAVLTNASQAGYRSRCLTLGADYFFDKSRDFDAVGPTLVARAAG